MNEIDRTDERLVRILGASRAPADAAVLVRARARLAGVLNLPGPLAWLGTPVALAAACALFVAVAGLSLTLAGTDSTPAHDTTLVSALIGDDGSYGLPAAGVTTTLAGATDSGTVAP